MKRSAACVAAVLALLALLAAGPASAGNKPVLRVLNWSNYIAVDETVPSGRPMSMRAPSLVEFSARHDCEIEYDEYDEESEMLKRLQNLPHYYDVVVVTQDIAGDLKAAGKLQKLPTAPIPNKAAILPRYARVPKDPKGEYTAAWMVGTTGIIYRADLVGGPVRSWKQYFEPDERLKGKIACLDDAKVMLAIGLKYLGKDIHTKNREDIKAAGRLFYDLKRSGYLSVISSEVEATREKLRTGELAMAVLYSGDSLALVRAEKEMEYVIPEEGGEYFVDSFVMLKDAPSRDLAAKFINHMLSPEVHAFNAMKLRYTCPNREALKIITDRDPSYLRDPAISPSDEVMLRLEFFGGLQEEEMNRVWGKITR